MKIKCPLFDDSNGLELELGDLFVHLSTEHQLGEIKHAYWRIIFKIHEKIESLNNIADEDFKHGYPSPSTETQIELLESLLDDEK